MAQGSRSTIINLDSDLIGQRLARPQKVFLAGREWTIRRDLDGAEVVEFWRHANDNNAPEAFTLLAGEEGKELANKLAPLPAMVYARIFSRLLQVAGIRRGDEPEDSTGESTAS